jgi:hypothetical protein
MADETSSNEEKAEKDSPTETVTVKKKVAKKKSAKKKVAKKKAATKKKVTAKKKAATAVASKETASVTAVGTGSEASTAKAEAKSATPTAVAEVSAVASKPSASTESKPAPSNVTVQTEPKKDTTSEDSSMTTDSKSASGFWLKVIFWLVIIILGFMYIRSLAINPQSEDSSAAVEQEAVEQEAVEPSTVVQSSATDEPVVEEDAPTAPATDDESDAVAETAQQGRLEPGHSVSPPEQEAMAIEPSESVESTTDTVQAADTVSTTEESVTAAETETAAPDSKSTSSTTDEMQSLRDMHAESVSKILKEFDDLRNATRAEIEAMRNRIQAERELREAMAPPRVWGRQGYSPYGGYPPAQQQGYSPYYGR